MRTLVLMTLLLFTTLYSVAADDEDAEILKDLDFFTSFEMVRNLDEIEKIGGLDEKVSE